MALCNGVGTLAAFVCLIAAAGCSHTKGAASADPAPRPASPTAAPSTPPRLIRATGTIRAARVYSIQVPRLEGVSTRMTLVTIARNGATVREGDVLAEFDRTQQLDEAQETQAKFDDLGHQVRQKQAQNKNDAEKRLSDISQAEGDLDKALINLRRGPVLMEIVRLQSEAKAEGARARLASLRKAHELRSKADAAALRILELQRERQKVALERSQHNAEKLTLRAPLSGMVALESIWRSGSMGPAQEGDQLWAGQPMLKIFDPSEMLVATYVNEPDNLALSPGARAEVRLDAYPDLIFEGRFESASPVASSAIGSPIKNFAAIFRLTRSDPRLLPDLAAAVVILPERRAP
jgi:HlyD family secretion protein